MYVQSVVEPEFVSIEMKVEERLRTVALRRYMDLEANCNTKELARQLFNIDALSPSEFRAIGYLLEMHDKIAHACMVDPDRIKEATEIGERVVRIIDNRLAMM